MNSIRSPAWPARLRICAVVGGIHPSSDGRPRNCAYAISGRGEVIGRCDERMLSRTKATLMYAPGRDPLVFTAHGMRFGCALGMETQLAELFLAYEELDVDCVLFSTAGNPETPGVFAIEAAGHAAANSIWISYAGPAQAGHPPARVIRPDGKWASRCGTSTSELVLTALEAEPARTPEHGAVLHAPSPSADCSVKAPESMSRTGNRTDQPVLHVRTDVHEGHADRAGGSRVSCRRRVATICNESQCGAGELGVQSGDPGPVSRHGEPRHVIVNVACGDQMTRVRFGRSELPVPIRRRQEDRRPVRRPRRHQRGHLSRMSIQPTP